MNLKEQHDKLLEQIPEGAIHDAEVCPICNPNLHPSTELESLDDEVEDSSDGGGDMKTYTEEEFTAAVQEAVAPLQTAAEAKVAELQSELEAVKAHQAKDEAEGQIAEVQAELDKAEIRVAEAERKYDELVAYLAAEAETVAEAARREERREGRRSAIKEGTALSDDVIEARLDRWVAMSDEDFDAHLEDLKALSTASRETSEDTEIPRETAMSNVRNDDTPTTSSIAKSVFAARNAGVDIRNI